MRRNCLTVSNLKLDSVLSDVFGKVSSKIIGQILANPSEKTSDVSVFRTKGMKATDEEVLDVLDGEMCPGQAEKLRIVREHMNGLELCKANLMSLILTTAEKYIDEIDLVSTTPVFIAFSAISVIGEIGVNMSVFPTSKIFVRGWVLLHKTIKAPERRKPCVSAVPVFTSNRFWFNALWLRSKAKNKHPEIITRYNALKKRRGHKQTVITIARMLLTTIYNILKKHTPYDPELYRKSDTPLEHRNVPVKEAMFILQRQGYIVSSPPIG